MIVVTIRHAETTVGSLFFMCAPRVGEYIAIEGKLRQVTNVIHAWDGNGIPYLNVEVGP